MQLTNEQWYIIVNPTACHGEASKYWKKIEATLIQHQLSFEVAFTQRRGHAQELVIEGLRKGYRCIIGAGGDGTNHEILNGIILQKIVAPTEILYTLLPIGTGNDWAYQYRIPSYPEKWVRQLSDGKIKYQDIASIHYNDENGVKQLRYGVNVIGLVYDAFVVQAMEANKSKITNRFIYMWWIIKCLFRFEPPKAKVIFNNENIEDYLYTINIGINRYSGGKMQFVPHAIPDDGLLALTVALKIPKWEVLLNTYRFYNGTLDKHPRISIFQTKKVRIESEASIGIEADGEFLGTTPIEINVLEKQLKILVP